MPIEIPLTQGKVAIVDDNMAQFKAGYLTMGKVVPW